MIFYILHDLLPSMLLFTMGFALVCLAALALVLICKGAQKISTHGSPVDARRSSVQASLQQDQGVAGSAHAYVGSTKIGGDGGAPYAAHQH
jgi:hypothetical protein